MPRHSGQLPPEILTQVLQYIEQKDLRACLLVCRAWHGPVQLAFYNEIEFSHLSSIDRFINRGLKLPYQQLIRHVKKISFIIQGFRIPDEIKPTLKRQFEKLVIMCPFVHTIVCSPGFKSFIIEELNHLCTPLNYLGAIPHADNDEYIVLTRRYCNTLKEYVLYKRATFEELKRFPCLKRLCLLHKSLREFEDAERILQMHPQLVELSVSLLKRDLNQESVVNSFKEPMEQYSNIKRLLVWNRCKSLNLEHLNSFISKFNCLKQLEIEANDILINEYPQLQLEELKIFLESVNTFPSVSFFIRGPYFKRGQPPGTIYSRYSRSESIWQSFDKAAEEREIGDSYKKRLRYISNHPTCRELGISIYDDCPAIHNLYYIQAFAPYINKLKIHFNNVSMQRISCVDFLHDIVTQCTVLDSLIILCGDFCRPLAFSTTTNTTLQTLILSKCLIKSPEFFPSLSRTCVGLRQLALSISQSSTNNVELIIMPVTELQQLDLDLEYLRSGIYNISRKALIMINDNSSRKWYFFIKYVNDQYYIVPGKRKMRGGLQVRIEIKKIERLRFFDDDVVGLERIVELS